MLRAGLAIITGQHKKIVQYILIYKNYYVTYYILLSVKLVLLYGSCTPSTIKTQFYYFKIIFLFVFAEKIYIKIFLCVIKLFR